MLCATIRYENPAAIHLANRHADLIELYLPHLRSSNLKELRKQCLKPVIFKMHEPNFEQLALEPDYVDLPHSLSSDVFDTVGKNFPKIKRICSYHDFEKTGDLESLFARIRTRPAEIYKMTTMAHSTSDALRMLRLVKKHRCLGICMGEWGVITRILAPVFQAPWTYAPLSQDQRTAPGQLLLQELVHIYNIRRHNSKTAIYGLIGDPVTKSSSHQMHNFSFKRLGLNAVYVKMRMTAQDLKHCFPLFRELGFKGLSVTMPLKEAVTPYLNHYQERAINTIRFCENGIYGWNTDGSGALHALEKRGPVKGKKVVILGAGGAAFGVALEAKKRGAHVTIVNRTLSKAQDLAEQVGGCAFPLEAFSHVASEGYDILINCTSVGMGEDKSHPVPPCHLLEKKLVMDIISKPRVTPLLAAAKEKECETVEGIEMFIQQAVGQYCHWFQEYLNE